MKMQTSLLIGIATNEKIDTDRISFCKQIHLSGGKQDDAAQQIMTCLMKCLREGRDCGTYQNDALAEVLYRGGAEDVPPDLDGPVVIICGHALEGEVVDAAGPQYGREARLRGLGALAVGNAIEGDMKGMGLQGELHCRYALEQARLQRLELSQRSHAFRRRLPYAPQSDGVLNN